VTREEAIQQIAAAAVDVERLTGWPAEVLFAQCALESGWLTSAPGNNAFGIKYVLGRHQQKQLLRTREWFTPDELRAWLERMPGRAVVSEEQNTDRLGRRLYVVMDWFAAYPSLADACADYVRLLTRGRYEQAWRRYQETRDWRQLVRDIAAAGYATAPDYDRKVLAMLDERAAQALAAARAAGETREV
jgi:flagellum-specific peptidoglycan hydrolase FlgJ